jgi:hypothetical protein
MRVTMKDKFISFLDIFEGEESPFNINPEIFTENFDSKTFRSLLLSCKALYHHQGLRYEWRKFLINSFTQQLSKDLIKVSFFSRDQDRALIKNNSSWLDLPSYHHAARNLFFKRASNTLDMSELFFLEKRYKQNDLTRSRIYQNLWWLKGVFGLSVFDLVVFSYFAHSNYRGSIVGIMWETLFSTIGFIGASVSFYELYRDYRTAQFHKVPEVIFNLMHQCIMEVRGNNNNPGLGSAENSSALLDAENDAELRKIKPD